MLDLTDNPIKFAIECAAFAYGIVAMIVCVIIMLNKMLKK